MTEGSNRVQPGRSDLLRCLRNRLPKLEDPLEIVAEQILGLESRIDFVARDRRGQVVLVLLAERGSDLALLADALAQRSWVAPRVADWLKLAPQLGLRPELGVRVLLLAPHFDLRTIAAAKSVEDPDITLGIYRCIRNGPEFDSLIEMLGTPLRASASVVEPLSSRFRTGLRPEELSR